MKLALIKDLEVQIGDHKRAIMLEYDLETYKERLCNIAYEYYMGNKFKIMDKLIELTEPKKGLFTKTIKYELNDLIIQDILKNSFSYAFNILEKEMKKQSVNMI